jgi:hypothetical protein
VRRHIKARLRCGFVGTWNWSLLVCAVSAAFAGVFVIVAADGTAAAHSRITPVSQASTSTRGVSTRAINVEFPVANLTSLASQLGFAGDVEYSEQVKAIQLFVHHVNVTGGINGRMINPMITTYDPTNEAAMQALCTDWTQGTPGVFAVLDGVGTWSGTSQLCVTRQGHTPFLGQWTTVTGWTTQGSPYLWWTGPDDAAILQAVVRWGHGAGLLGGSRRVGVLVGDRASDELALKQYLLPDLQKLHITPQVVTIPSQPSETAATNSAAQLAVERFKAAGVNSVIPLIPFNAFFPVLGDLTSQDYFPRLLLSDYEESIESSLGLIPIPFEKALDGQDGVTTETLGGVDDSRPESQGGYDPGDRQCWGIWHQAYPQIPKGNMNDFIEEQGPIQGWCQEIRLFTQAATMAGKNLDVRTFVEAMSRITDFPGGYSPVLSYAPTKFYGPAEYQVVRLHTNEPPSSQCRLPLGTLPPQKVCWHVIQKWKPLPTAP